ncbi:MAG: CBS domain-containing protein [Streptosporangiales bacterium]|nr:CBS domain-containing protein [Streptosporangiales bacterium]
MRRMRVEDVMARRPITVTPDTPFKQVVAALLDHLISAVPVLDATGRVVGVVSEADLVLKEAEPDVTPDGHVFEGPRRRRERRKSTGRTAAELMTAPAVTISPTRTVAEVAEVMRKHRVRRLPVTDPVSGRLLGVVSRSDLLRVYLRADGEIQAQVSEVFRRALSMDPRRFVVGVRDGVVTVRGEVERRALIPGVVNTLAHVEGVVGVEPHLTYREDDRHPTAPTYW